VTEAGHAPLDAFGVAWRLGATLFFVLLNGFFVAAEFALVKVRPARVEELARAGSRGAAGAKHVLRHLALYLSACQLGITLASLILGALGEPAVSVLLLAAARGLGLDVDADASWLPVVSIGIAFAVITTLHMTIGEQAPKMWALQRAEGMALRTSLALRAFTWVFRPFIHAINRLSNAMLRLGGLDVTDDHESSHSAEEIRSILSLSARAGHISERQHEITVNVFRLMELEVRHIVVPRVEVEYLSLEHELEKSLDRIRRTGHSRLPLCEVGLDSIVGFVHSKDVLAGLLANEPVDLRAMARDALFVSDTMSVSNFIVELQERQAHCAVVVDEHGTAIGLGFREDALEEIVGPLGDEFDEPERLFADLGDGIFEASGRLPLPEVFDRLGLSPEDDDEGEETLGGWVTARLGRLPRKGDRVRLGGYRATVASVARRRVERLRLEPAPPDPDEDADDA